MFKFTMGPGTGLLLFFAIGYWGASTGNFLLSLAAVAVAVVFNEAHGIILTRRIQRGMQERFELAMREYEEAEAEPEIIGQPADGDEETR